MTEIMYWPCNKTYIFTEACEGEYMKNNKEDFVNRIGSLAGEAPVKRFVPLQSKLGLLQNERIGSIVSNFFPFWNQPLS